MIEWTIHLGDLLQISALLVVASSLFSYIKLTLQVHQKRLDNLDAQMGKQTDILLEIARNSVEHRDIERRLAALERSCPGLNGFRSNNQS